jgi:SpoVK/Ycf46/Vps4 family AAA+-type ATPase
MAVDKSVLTAIESAVEAEPTNIALRLHLASLLFEDAQFAESLKHSQTVLADDPVNTVALQKAANAAEKLGDLGKAESYRRVLGALTGETKPEKPKPLYAPKFSSNDDWADILTDEDSEKVSLKESYDGGQENDFLFETEAPDIKLSDVAGMEAVKRRLHLAFLAPLQNPEMMKLYGKSLRGGLMLYGAPGCGKTFIARAVAGELGARFLSVGLSDVLDMWIGSSEKNIHEVFARARRQAPCVLFFDEIDALGRKRSLTRNSAHGAINQLLSELDGISQNNDGVFVLAATNHPWDVDSALRRPGRLDRTVLVLPPDKPAREAILNSNLRGRPVDASLDTDSIAKTTNEFSGADVAHLVESAAELAMEDSLTSGKVRSISQNDFKRALREVKPSTKPWFEIAKNYALFSNDGGVYDDLLEYLKQARMI